MILVTGATGFLGSHVLFELVGMGHSVKALYRDRKRIEYTKRVFSYYSKDLMPLWNNIEWIQGDLMDYYTLSKHVSGVSMVFHTAGMVSFNSRDRDKLMEVNAGGTTNLVNACLESGAAALCHVSSIATLGEGNESGPVDESMLWNPGKSASAYAISKHNGEMEVWRGIHEGLSAVIVNPAVIIGPGMWMGSARQLLESIHRGLKFFPSGTSGYVDVRDVASVMVRLMEKKCYGERFVVSAANISHREVINQIAEAMKRPKPAYRITPFISKTALMAEYFRSVITGFPPRITKKTIEIASEKLQYSDQKLRETLGYSFITIEDSIRFSIPIYRAETDAAG